MKVKIQKLIPYTEQSKKTKNQPPITIGNKPYLISPNALDHKNYTGAPILLAFSCQFPDVNQDYEYLKYQLRIQYGQNRELVKKEADVFKEIKKGQGSRREFVVEMVLPYQGAYNLLLDLAYKPQSSTSSSKVSSSSQHLPQTQQNSSTSLPMQQKRQSLKMAINCELPFEIQENIIYQQKPASVSFPMFVQYIIHNRTKDVGLQIRYEFQSQAFGHVFLNTLNQNGSEKQRQMIDLKPLETYYLLIQIKLKQTQKNQKPNILFGDKSHLIGILNLYYLKSISSNKLYLKQGYKHLLFKGESVDKKVVKKDIIQFKIKFMNIYEMDYNIGQIRIGLQEKQIPAGIKLLKISKDRLDLTKNKEETITLTMICMRSGVFLIKGIVLNIKDKNNMNQQRILKYVNQLYVVVENQREKKGEVEMEKTGAVEVEVESLI